MRRRRLVFAALGLVCVGGALGTVLWKRARSVSARAGAAVVAPEQLPRCALHAGDRAAFDAELSIETSVDLGSLVSGMNAGGGVGLATSPPQRVKETRRFALALEVKEAMPRGGFVLGAQLRGLAGTQEGATSPIAEPGVDAPFLIRLDDRCAITEFGWSKSAAPEGVRQQQALVASLSYQLPGAKDGARYASFGFDATGPYRAINQLVSSALVSRVLRYERYFRAERDARGGEARTRIERAQLRVGLAPGRWLTQADRELELRFLLGASPVGRFALRAHFRAVDPTGATPPAPAEPLAWGHVLDQALASDAIAEAPTVPDERLRPLTLAQVMEDVGRRVRDARSNPAEYVVLLADWLKLHPEALPGLLEQIRSGALDSQPRLQAALLHGMATANTTETRGALTQIFDGKDFPYGRRVDAAQVMVLLDPPPKGFLEGLVRESGRADDRFGKGSMQLALGMFAAQHDKAHPELAAQARTEIRRALDHAGKDETALVHALQSAGNSGADELHGEVARHLSDRSSNVREVAADSMRNFSADRALSSIEEAYGDERDAGVRGRLLDSATQVLRRDGRAPSERLLSDATAEVSAPATTATFTQALELLGVASSGGSSAASEAIERLFEAERAKGAGADPARLQALGRFVHTRWVVK